MLSGRSSNEVACVSMKAKASFQPDGRNVQIDVNNAAMLLLMETLLKLVRLFVTCPQLLSCYSCFLVTQPFDVACFGPPKAIYNT